MANKSDPQREQPGDASVEQRDNVVANENEQSLSRVRDILFGEQFTVLQEKLQSQEQRFTQELQNLRKQSEDQIASTHQLMQQTVSALSTELAKQSTQRAEDNAQWTMRAREIETAFERNLEATTQRASSSNESLRLELQSQADALRQQLEAQKQDMSAKLTDAISELTSDKLSKTNMAELLQQLASHIAGEHGTEKKIRLQRPTGKK